MSPTPFSFTQTSSVPVYFDFCGGTLNLKGSWDFASLTSIPNSDFRVEGVAAQSSGLSFTPITIGADADTRIVAVPEPAGIALLASSAAIAGGVARKRRRR